MTSRTPGFSTRTHSLTPASMPRVATTPPFSAHGRQKPQFFLTGGYLGATALKKPSPDRIKELLGILNYLAAPFGSAEDLLLTSGVDGVDYTLDPKGNPVLTKQGNSDANYTPWK